MLGDFCLRLHALKRENKRCYDNDASNRLSLLRCGRNNPIASFHPFMTKQEWIARIEFLAKTSKNLTGDLLSALGEFMSRAQFSYMHPSFMGDPFGPEILAEIREAQLRREIKERARYLRRKKYVEHQRKGDTIIAKITDDGLASIFEQDICKVEQRLPDGEYVVVAFDIPEDTKLTRQLFRRRLKTFGFEQHQLSVWICQRDVAEEVVRWVQAIGAQRWVSVFRARLMT
ncbi:TPA: CRISPR-associated endonuclease Cas2 [Candidatus Uhrbacteria bacterium]|uniref:Transcriptional repressor PaaX-like central Cas2-like domain-containing protein n=1 Tax=Candidatus Uhrbacteria bacterium GW2011_GWC2_53_7 TaxID=1618986 RepID=A0A0G1Y0D3_9BACT|nr:MAG: hypothetical protein UY79_C0001G0070 [Parcubacteria group bacterium GW2011_GWA2_53_21]KKW36656.1 MAG: hypothetical protein UY82_C0016G0001 [Candidatus Uhrbacteria bacterium GW2011_GWC2_53_7]HBL39604.1 CRISPR-associated endonuclease Cas2 [Candidatus Uhrbacteria bacterium]